jgi:hypothetical protein
MEIVGWSFSARSVGATSAELTPETPTKNKQIKTQMRRNDFAGFIFDGILW